MPEETPFIAVVDDDDVKRYTITHTLRRAGFHVEEGSKGADALRLAPQATVIVLDVKMPDLNGFDVCRQIKNDPATSHVLVLMLSTTFVGVESQVKGLDSGADAYLTTATEPPVLLATVHALIRMRRAEEQARRGEARLRVALAAGRLGEWDLDIASKTLACSAQCMANFGRAAEAPFSLADLEATVHPDDREKVHAALRRATEENCGLDTEYRVVRPSGEVRWLQMQGQVVTVGIRRHLTGVSLDVTERKLTEEALREADRKKDEFLALLAHELRNPLAPIRTALEIERQPGADDAAINRARETMARQLHNMVRLIDDLLDVSRITKGKIELRRERVDLRMVLTAAVETSRPLIDAGRHHLTTDLPSQPVWLDADPTRLAQVVANLLNNAAKYTHDGGQIRLSATVVSDQEKSFAEIRVADNGTGIPPEILPRMWEMFAQADRTLGRAKGGLGIGLTLVKRLVELHGGTVGAHSGGRDQGSEFTVRLPITEGSSVGTAPARPGVPQVSHRRILVVDDNEDGLETLAILLELSGHAVQTAADGPSALAAAETFRPDVVLLDIGLPGMDGYEVARRLRANPVFRQTRLIALTGWGQDNDRQQSRDAGFDLHLVKPIDPAELRRVL
jgi:signal transduction histidine kinase/DNA-binding response OmpR family regulator